MPRECMLVVRVWMLSLAVLAIACSGGGDQPSGRYIRGTIAKTSARSAVAAFGDPSLADAIWVIPVHSGLIDENAFQERVELPLAADGSFTYSEAMGNYNGQAVFALVTSSACLTGTPRASWTEADIDARLGCLQGFVSISDAQASGALTVIPLGDQQDGVELGMVSSGGQGEALSDTSLTEASSSFSLDLDDLRTIARTDERVKGFAYVYANRSDTLADFYNMHLLYDWQGPLSSANNAETSPAALSTPGFEFQFDTDVAVGGTPLNQNGYFQIYPPAPVTIPAIPATFGPAAPLISATPGFSYDLDLAGRLAGAAGLFAGTSPAGEWKLRRNGASGPIVSKYDLALTSPFALVNGQPDPSQPTLLLPTIVINNTGGTVDSITWSFKVFDGTGYVAVPSELAVSLIGSPQLGIIGDGSAGCPSAEFVRLDLEPTSTLTPPSTYVLGTGDLTTCGVTSVFIGYFSMRTLYQFFWS